MNLWIRSQDKSALIEADNLYVNEGRIVLIAGIGGRVTIGKYSSQKRALKVLDEIQKIIGWCQNGMKCVTFGDINKLIGSFEDYVYEMPLE